MSVELNQMRPGLRIVRNSQRVPGAYIVWEVTDRAVDRYDYQTGRAHERWQIRAVEVTPRQGPYTVGWTTTCGQNWLRECDLVSMSIDPPCGDGEQQLEIRDGNNLVLCAASFSTNADMAAWLDAELRRLVDVDDHPAGELRVHWYGWLPDDDGERPDMTATIDPDADDWALIWAD